MYPHCCRILKFQHLIWRGHEQKQYAKSDIKIRLCLFFPVALVDSATAAAVVNLVAVVHLIAVVNRIDVVNRVECTLSRMPTCFRCTLGSCNCWRCSKIVRCSKSSREQTFKNTYLFPLPFHILQPLPLYVCSKSSRCRKSARSSKSSSKQTIKNTHQFPLHSRIL